LPFEAPGTPFEMRVWKALCEIPYGQTRSYADIAQAVDSPAAVRAVGRANGLNRIAIVIPCHRVVNKSGELGGYGGWLWRKRRLLHLEAGRRSMVRTVDGSSVVGLHSGLSSRSSDYRGQLNQDRGLLVARGAGRT
jgi:O-6-methylguanine DNA methyltransferase